MRVVHLSTFADHGGAARAAERIHSGLLQIGIDSSFLVAEAGRAVNKVRVATLPPTASVHRRKMEMALALAPYARSRPNGFELFSADLSIYGQELISQVEDADVVHLHWVSRFVDISPFIETVAKSKPIIWTLHDMNAFTGGCHYDAGCGRYRDSCGACPQLGSHREDDLSRDVLNRKNQALMTTSQNQLQFVAVSRWLEERARDSALLASRNISTIYNAVDTDVFHPSDRKRARAELGLPQNGRFVLFVAANPDLPRKGLSRLVKAAANGTGWTLLVVGPRSEKTESANARLCSADEPAIKYLGFIRDDTRLALVYTAADLTVVPSKQEAFGLTALESMACGTPVIAHPAGGLTEIVTDRRTGRLANENQLPGTIEELLSASESVLTQMANEASAFVRSRFAINTVARNYVNLYKSALDHNESTNWQPGN